MLWEKWTARTRDRKRNASRRDRSRMRAALRCMAFGTFVPVPARFKCRARFLYLLSGLPHPWGAEQERQEVQEVQEDQGGGLRPRVEKQCGAQQTEKLMMARGQLSTRNRLENGSGMAVNGPPKAAIYCHARGRFSGPQTQERRSFAISGLVESPMAVSPITAIPDCDLLALGARLITPPKCRRVRAIARRHARAVRPRHQRSSRFLTGVPQARQQVRAVFLGHWLTGGVQFKTRACRSDGLPART